MLVYTVICIVESAGNLEICRAHLMDHFPSPGPLAESLQCSCCLQANSCSSIATLTLQPILHFFQTDLIALQPNSTCWYKLYAHLVGHCQAGRLRSTRCLVPLPGRLLACRRAVLGTLAAGALLHLQQRLADTRQVLAPATTHKK